ncbi:MAG: ATP-binding protein [Saprospiraceae bacterium]
MKTILSSYIFHFLCALAGFSQAGQMPPTPLYFKQALKEARVLEDFQGFDNLYEDQDRFIWFLSDKGMFRYDGVGLMPVMSDPIDLNSLSSNRVKDVIQNEQGVFWITTRNGGLNAYDAMTGKFTHYRHDANDETTLSTDDLFFLQKDPDGKLWIGSNVGMNIFDPNTGKNTRVLPRPGVAGELQGHPWSPVIIAQQRVYVLTTAGLEFFDQKEQKWHYFPVLDEKGDTIRVGISSSFSTPKSICMDRKGLLWLGMPNRSGLWVFDAKTSRLTAFGGHTAAGGQVADPGAILEDRSGRLWVAAQNGIWRLSPDRETLEHCKLIDNDKQQELKNIPTIFRDRSGLIWTKVTTEKSPYFFDPNQEMGHVLKLPRVNNQPIATNHILFDPNGLIWLATNSGIMRCNPLSGETSYAIEGVICYNAIFWEDNYLLACTNEGLLVLDKKSGRSWPVRLGSAVEEPIPEIMCATTDHDGDLWFSTWGNGLYHLRRDAFDVRSGIATAFEQWKYGPSEPSGLPSNLLASIAVDAGNKIWVCGAENGLNSVDKSTGKVQRYMYEQGNVNGIASNYTSELQIDNDGDIWISLGLKLIERFSPETGHFKKYDSSDGLPNYSISQIAKDKTGKIWINQTQVVSCIDPATGDVAIFPQVAATSLYHEAIVVHPETNEVYFACQGEVRSFNPATFKNQGEEASPILLSKVSHYDPAGDGNMLELPENQWKKTALSLTHLENTVEIEYALLDYRNPQSREYAYSLTESGSQPRWIYAGSKNTVSFANLSPGSYLFSVKGRNSYGVWNEEPTSLSITIRPPWWATWWAYLLYAIAAIFGLIGIRNYEIRRKLAATEALRLQELDEFKNRFFTNITHEFRTPLTVILGTSEQVEMKVDDGLKSKIKLIRRNGENLLRLINQILDLAKLESKALKINYVQGDVLPYLRYIAESLHSYANAQNVLLRVESKEREIVMDYDPERLLQIVYNLLSNAIKFTPSGGRVVLNVGRVLNPADAVTLTVTDTGAGIPSADLPHIFDRFHQANNLEKAKAGGTGIGLALTKELVTAMGGEISVESEEGKGSTFTVQLPVTNRSEKREVRSEESQSGSTSVEAEVPSSLLTSPLTPPLTPKGGPSLPNTANIPEFTTKLPILGSPSGVRGGGGASSLLPPHPSLLEKSSLLIIEDNPDVVEYLADCLRESYALDFAYNGRAGIEKALETVPDLIVSDVMMPEKDGFEVVETLKHDERSSHIPIVLLTAKADVESRIKGLRRGADAYLAKPFHQEELLVTLNNLLELRRKLQLKYSELASQSPITSHQSPVTDAEDAFLQKVRDAVTEHLSDPQFSVDDLCRSLAMSQPQLHRKLTALTGKNATIFIRSIRLAKAKELLRDNGMTVSEVAWAVGFTDPKYFSRVFSEAFGVSPSKF